MKPKPLHLVISDEIKSRSDYDNDYYSLHTRCKRCVNHVKKLLSINSINELSSEDFVLNIISIITYDYINSDDEELEILYSNRRELLNHIANCNIEIFDLPEEKVRTFFYYYLKHPIWLNKEMYPTESSMYMQLSYLNRFYKTFSYWLLSRGIIESSNPEFNKEQKHKNDAYIYRFALALYNPEKLPSIDDFFQGDELDSIPEVIINDIEQNNLYKKI